MGDILTALREQRLRSIKRSIQYQEQREAATAYHSQLAKSVISGKPLDSSLPLEAQALRTLYYDMLKDYQGETFKIPGPLTKRGEALWNREEKARQAAGVDPKKFMKAQFVWFDKTFGKAPTAVQCATEAAVQRVLEVGDVQVKRVVGAQPANVPLADVFRQSEKLLRDMMRAQKGYVCPWQLVSSLLVRLSD